MKKKNYNFFFLLIFIYIKKFINFFLNLLNYKLISYKNYEKFSLSLQDTTDLKFIKNFKNLNSINFLEMSKSELRQDLFVLNLLNYKKKGYFVEFGVGDGVKGSNSYLLEKEFNWTGIVAESATLFKNNIFKVRNCNVEMKAVYVKSDLELVFSENTFNPYLSTISKFISHDAHYLNRLCNKKNYLVKTISLIDLLKKYNAPKIIDYLSIDTEGSEFAILNNFDFSKYKIKIITCEHNFSSNRNKILKLLTKNGYRRIYKNISNFDDWFVNNSFL
jgi:hypothetical protein